MLRIPVLGSISRIRGRAAEGVLITAKQPRSPEAESFRILRTNLQFKAAEKSLRIILVTSSTPEEGKSVVASNLAVAFAQNNLRVVLVDADLRRPTQHQIFNLPGDRGLTTALLSPNDSVAEFLQPSGTENLRILATGLQPPNPSELLGSKRMEEVLDALLREADLVVFDSPPVLVASDASVLAMRADGTLMVIDAGRTRRAQANRTLQALRSVEATLLGAVLNRADARASGYSYSYYYSDSGKRRSRASGSKRTLLNVMRRFKRSSVSTPDEAGEVYAAQSKAKSKPTS